MMTYQSAQMKANPSRNSLMSGSRLICYNPVILGQQNLAVPPHNPSYTVQALCRKYVVYHTDCHCSDFSLHQLYTAVCVRALGIAPGWVLLLVEDRDDI